jgi:osmotically-inducible protein OsmY
MVMINLEYRWQQVQRPLATAILCACMVTSLQGCVEMVIGSAVMSTFGAQTEDKSIIVKGELSIANLVGSSGHVNVTSFNRKVLLTGEVKDEKMKEAVERTVAAIDGVQSVNNDLEVMFLSDYTSRSNDVFITGKVKTRLVEAKDIFANSFKVVTERGTVYLMGRVTQREAAIASEATRTVSGVQKVVKVFEYLSDDELKKLSSKPA